MLVVNEPGVAEAVNRLRGEWAEWSGGELSATSKTWAEISQAKNLDADAIIFPSRYLGDLSARGWLRPVRSAVLESKEFDADDVYPAVRRELIRWGGEVMALPLGANLMTAENASAAHPAIAFLGVVIEGIPPNEREAALFDPQTMKPRINDPTFTAALKRFAEAGQPTVPAATALPRIIPVIGFGDRLVSVTTSSRNGASAFKLVAWLASAEISSQLQSSGERMLAVRRSLASSSAWNDPALSSADRSAIAKALEVALSGDNSFLIPRIPGIDEYLAALDDAVKSVSQKKADGAAALQNAAERWEKITDARGRDDQREAYLKHLGIGQ